MVEFIRNSVEFREWGINILTLSSIATIILTVFQGYGLMSQNQQIWKMKSAESISELYFSFNLFYFSSFVIYGISQNSLAMIFNGLLGIIYIPIIVGILKFKKIPKNKKISMALMAIMVPAMAIFENKNLFISILLIGILLLLFRQLAEIAILRNRGALSLKFILVFLATTVFWLIYAIMIANLPLAIFNLIAMISFIFLLYFYFKYGEEKEKKNI